MWTLNETRQLTVTEPATSWIRDRVLAVAAAAASEHRVTGTQTFAARTPADDASDYLCFDIALHGTLGSAEFGYVLDDSTPHAARVSSVSEALHELIHGACFGDLEMNEQLVNLLGATGAAQARERYTSAL